MGLENCFVSCEKNLDLLRYMYPRYKVKYSIFMDQDNYIIYAGKPFKGFKEKLEKETKGFISVCFVGRPDYDLDSRECLIELAYEKWKDVRSAKTLNNDIKSLLRSMSDIEFEKVFKVYWSTGIYIGDSEGYKAFDLFNSLGKSRHDVMKNYLSLCDTIGYKKTFSRVVGFLESSTDLSTVEHSNGLYQKSVKEFKRRTDRNLKRCLLEYYKMEAPEYYKYIWLMYMLGRGRL